MTDAPKKISVIEKIKTILPVAIAAATVTGFGYLFLYTTKHGIPFPLALSSLPSLLIATMAVAVVLGAIILCLMLLPAIAKSAASTSDYSNLFDKERFSKSNIKTYLETTGWCILLPVILLYMHAMFPQANIVTYFLWPSFLYALLSSIHYVWKISKDKKKETAAVVLWINILSCVWIFSIVSIILKSIPHGISNWWFWLGYPAGLSILLIINYILIIPRFDIWENINRNSFIALFILSILFPLLISPIGEFLTDKSMYMLRLGGGYKSVFYLENNSADNMPKIIIDDKIKNSTKQVYVFLNIGDTKYVSLTDEKNKEIYGIKSKSIITEIIMQ